MKLYFHNMQTLMATSLRDKLQRYSFSVNLSLPEGIILLYAKDDSTATRTMVRSAILQDSSPLFIFSDNGSVAEMAWRLGAAHFTNVSKADWMDDFGFGFSNFLLYRTADYHKRIAIPSQRKVDFISPAEITYLKADRNYTEIFLRDNTKLILAKNLKELEKLLAEFDFIERFGKSIIINLNNIRSVNGKTIEFMNAQKLSFPKYGNSFVYLKDRLMWKIPKKTT